MLPQRYIRPMRPLQQSPFFGGDRVVKSFQQEDYEIGKFKKISQGIYQDFAKGERIIALNSPMMQTCMYGCMILISWIGAKAIVASGSSFPLPGPLWRIHR